MQAERNRRLGRAMIAELPALRRYAIGLAGSREAGEDLVQDTIERAVRRMESLQDEAKMPAWLRSILFNLFISDRRQFRSRGERVDQDMLELMADPRVQPDLRQEAADVLRAASRLSPQHCQILLLVGVEGLSYKEVAEELDLKLGTVMSRLARARDQLRDALAARPARRA